MAYQVLIIKKVQKDLKIINNPYRLRLDAALVTLAIDPYIGKSLSISHLDQYSYKVGQHRIIYKIFKSKLAVVILKVAHR